MFDFFLIIYPGAAQTAKQKPLLFRWGAPPPLPRKSAATAASRGTSLLRFTVLLFYFFSWLFFLHRWENSQGIFSPVQGQLTLHRWKKSLGIFSPVQGQIDLLRLAAQGESKYSISPCTGWGNSLGICSPVQGQMTLHRMDLFCFIFKKRLINT